ncbi:serpin B12-like isoform X2 [Epargyreus clarus]
MFEEISASNIDAPFNDFTQVVERLEHKFYDATFRKFLSISHPERQENGITFAQSGLFLYLQLMTLCTESEVEVTTQIMQSLGLKTTCEEQVQVLNRVMAILPRSSTFLKFRWSSRLVLAPQLNVSEKFLENTAPALQVVLDLINNTDNPEELTNRLNLMVAKDSGGAMHSTFEEEELSNGICAVWLTTLYMRARWRSAPTVLNGSRPFYDGNAPPRTVRMIRINDQMKYASLDEWDAEAIEIRYAIPDLTLLLLVPRGRSLKNLANWVSKNNLQSIYKKMQEKRVAVSLPIYTLRMTLLLPGKLETMGISSLVQAKTDNNCNALKLSHAVQRIMFWAEAGRNAYKDDGIEWDEKPELEIVVNRPYIFFVRWRNLTLLSGNFVL